MKKLETLGDLDREAVTLAPGDVSMVLFQERAEIAIGAVLHHHAPNVRMWIYCHAIEGHNVVVVMNALQDLELCPLRRGIHDKTQKVGEEEKAGVR